MFKFTVRKQFGITSKIKRWRDQDKKDREGGSKKKRIPKIR